MSVTSNKPYLIRALCEWCADNSLTPLINVRVDAATKVPKAFVRDGQIVLNIAEHATHQLTITNEEITFQARFGGVAQALYIPIQNVTGIFAREVGQGMSFELEADQAQEIAPAEQNSSDQEPPEPPSTPKPPAGAHLRVVK